MNEIEQDDLLDRQLREAAPYIDDAGFTARVLQKLPQKRSHRESQRAFIMIGMAVFASLLAYFLSDGGRFVAVAVERLSFLPMLCVYALAVHRRRWISRARPAKTSAEALAPRITARVHHDRNGSVRQSARIFPFRWRALRRRRCRTIVLPPNALRLCPRRTSTPLDFARASCKNFRRSARTANHSARSS